MYCPQCGTESQSTQYCRTCGANLKVIGKAVALSEAVARSDRGPLPKIKEMIKEFKVDHVSDEVSGALDRMNQEIAKISPESQLREPGRPWVSFGRKKTPAEKRENHISKGVVSLFSGVGLRSDRGPLPKIKEMIKEFKVDHVSDEVSGALDRMNQEIAKISPESQLREPGRPWVSFGRKKTPAEKRENHISKGVVSLFSGVGL